MPIVIKLFLGRFMDIDDDILKLENEIKAVKNKINTLDELLFLEQNSLIYREIIGGPANLAQNTHDPNDSVFQQRYRLIAKAKANKFKILKQNNKYFDKLGLLSRSSSLPNFQVNASQLPFDDLSFMSKAFGETIRSHLLKDYSDSIEKKVVPIPGLEADFCYDFSENTATWLGPMQLIYGFGKTCEASFEEILGLVVFRDKQRFQDVAFGSVGRESHVITKPILLENGNTIIEEYNFLYHKGDYEKRSPVLLQGKTKLVCTGK